MHTIDMWDTQAGTTGHRSVRTGSKYLSRSRQNIPHCTVPNCNQSTANRSKQGHLNRLSALLLQLLVLVSIFYEHVVVLGIGERIENDCTDAILYELIEGVVNDGKVNQVLIKPRTHAHRGCGKEFYFSKLTRAEFCANQLIAKRCKCNPLRLRDCDPRLPVRDHRR